MREITRVGSASIATDGGGAVIANSEMAYKPFGGVLGGGTGLDTPYRFTNQRSDESATGLYDYNARFYSPSFGRFVSADSIVPGAGNPQALNRYAYVFNNPLKFVDPSGHASQPVAQGTQFVVTGSGVRFDWNHSDPEAARRFVDELQKLFKRNPQGQFNLQQVANDNDAGWQYQADYWVGKCEDCMTNPDSFNRMAMAIWMNYQYRFERDFQGSKPTFAMMSSFAPEDLPSEKLALLTVLLNRSRESIIDEFFGGIQSTSNFPVGASTIWSRNYTDKPVDVWGRKQAWPAALDIQPSGVFEFRGAQASQNGNSRIGQAAEVIDAGINSYARCMQIPACRFR